MTADKNPQQRIRITFAKGEAIKYISHLDLNRAWERAFRRAGLPLAYSQGFNPKPKVGFGPALAVGISGSGPTVFALVDTSYRGFMLIMGFLLVSQLQMLGSSKSVKSLSAAIETTCWLSGFQPP